MDISQLPKLPCKDKGLTAHYSMCLTPDMKQALMELKAFHGIDTPSWIRSLILEALAKLQGQK